MIGGRRRRGGGENMSQNKGGEATVKMDDGRKEGRPRNDGGVIERQIQIKPYAGRAWMIKPGA